MCQTGHNIKENFLHISTVIAVTKNTNSISNILHVTRGHNIYLIIDGICPRHYIKTINVLYNDIVH